MSLLYPLGLIALASIIILIIIYLIKPNYQNKFVSSTFVWKLSLKFKRKKLPTSKLRNILLILCQVLILTLFASIIAYPIIKYKTEQNQNETIAIIDTSASMRTETESHTRFERAVEKVRQLSNEATKDGGVMTLILASNTANILFEKSGSDKLSEINNELDELLNGDTACTYGTSDVEAALTMCDNMLADNPTAKVYLYSDKGYDYIPTKNPNFKYERIVDESEKNDAILDAYVEFNDNYYDIIVEVATYGNVDKTLCVYVEVQGANAVDKNDIGQTIRFDTTVDLEQNVSSKLIFKGTDSANSGSDNVFLEILDSSKRFSSFNRILVSIEEGDSYSADDSFWIYGGQKEVIKVQYSSSSSNGFVSGILYTLQAYYKDTYDIQITEEKKNKPELKGFDYYIFEHKMPQKLPTDGVCILIDPLSSPTNAGFYTYDSLGDGKHPINFKVEDDAVDSPLLNDIDVAKMQVTKYTKLSQYDSDYKVLASIDQDPLLMYKDNGTSKVFVFNFSLHYSNLPIIKEFAFLFNNIIKYYTPSIVEKNSYEVGETISLKSRGRTLEVRTDDKENNKEFEEFPASMVVSNPGTYTVSQTTYFDKDIYEDVYVRVPKEESNIFLVEDSLRELYYEDTSVELFNDLVLYFAIGLVTLLFFEWWLKNRDNV